MLSPNPAPRRRAPRVGEKLEKGVADATSAITAARLKASRHGIPFTRAGAALTIDDIQ
jgi:hypothetical protein